MNERLISTYYFDGSFDGYLNCVFKAITEQGFPDIIKGNVPKKLASVSIKTNNYISNLMKKILFMFKADTAVINSILYCYLCESIVRFEPVIRYISRFLITGYKAEYVYDKILDEIEDNAEDVKEEAFDILSICKFSKIENCNVCFISPKHNVLPIAVKNLILKNPDFDFILADKIHNAVFIYEKHKGIFAPFSDVHLFSCTQGYEQMRKKWITILNKVAVSEKTTLRQSYYNNHYWSNLLSLIEISSFSPLLKEEAAFIKSKNWKLYLDDKKLEAALEPDEYEPVLLTRASNSFDLSYILGYNVDPLKNDTDSLSFKLPELYVKDFNPFLTGADHIKPLRLMEFIYGTKLFNI